MGVLWADRMDPPGAAVPASADLLDAEFLELIA